MRRNGRGTSVARLNTVLLYFPRRSSGRDVIRVEARPLSIAVDYSTWPRRVRHSSSDCLSLSFSFSISLSFSTDAVHARAIARILARANCDGPVTSETSARSSLSPVV